MKIANCILAFYTILLSCFPCQDEVAAIFSAHQKAVVAATSERDAHGDEDLCSPFCICACCASVTLSQVFAALPEAAAALFYQSKTYSYTTPVHSELSGGIWQPPQA